MDFVLLFQICTKAQFICGRKVFPKKRREEFEESNFAN
jgi:hypothetical protein